MTRKAGSRTVAPGGCKVDGCASVRMYTRGLCALHWCTRADLADAAPPVGMSNVDKARQGR